MLTQCDVHIPLTAAGPMERAGFMLEPENGIYSEEIYYYKHLKKRKYLSILQKRNVIHTSVQVVAITMV